MDKNQDPPSHVGANDKVREVFAAAASTTHEAGAAPPINNVRAHNVFASSNDDVHSFFPSIAAGMSGGGEGLRLYETDSFLNLSLDLPGVRAKDFELFVRNSGVLYIKGVRLIYDDEYQDDGENPNAIAKKYTFSQTFAVNTNVVNMKKARANLSKGVLVMRAPKYINNETKRELITTTFVIPVSENNNGTPPNDEKPQTSASSAEEKPDGGYTSSANTTKTESDDTLSSSQRPLSNAGGPADSVDSNSNVGSEDIPPKSSE